MTETPKLFARKAFFVNALRVTETNIQEVAAWCGGDVRKVQKPAGASVEEFYIQVDVNNPLTERQTKAFLGDWVLEAGTGYKVYTDTAFKNNFDEVRAPEKK